MIKTKPALGNKAPPALRIKHLREKIRLRDVLTHFGHRYRTNGNMICPFHSEKNPSARLYDDQDSIWCWTCSPGHGVDIVEFVIIELGLEADSPTRGVAVLRAIEYLEENFATSYLGVPWQNRLATSLHRLEDQNVTFDPQRYWESRHLQILQLLATINDPAKWSVYDSGFLQLRELRKETESIQNCAWHQFAVTLGVLK